MIFYIPAVSAEHKTPSGEPPHYAEDEGLYVGERPKVNWTNQVVVENRLLKRRDKVYTCRRNNERERDWSKCDVFHFFTARELVGLVRMVFFLPSLTH